MQVFFSPIHKSTWESATIEASLRVLLGTAHVSMLRISQLRSESNEFETIDTHVYPLFVSRFPLVAILLDGYASGVFHVLL